MAISKPPHNSGDASKAYRLRKAVARGEVLKPIDRLWLDEYDHQHPASPKAGEAQQASGRSRSARKISFDLEEAAEAEGHGEGPAAIAAAAALQSREEGRRLDSLTVSAVGALEKAVETYRQICESLQAMLETYQSHHLDTLSSVRDHYLARTASEAELDRMKKDKDDADPINNLVAMVAAKHLGIDMSAVSGAVGAAAKAADQAPNGTARKK